MKTIAFAIIGFMLVTPLMAQEVLEITVGEFPPFTGKELPHEGFLSHIIRESFKYQGVNIKFIYYPWKRAFSLAKQGKYVATSYWFCNEDRQAYFYCSKNPVLQTEYSFFYLKSNPMQDWSTLDDLKKYVIGITGGYSYTPEFDAMAANGELKTHAVPTDLQNLKKLLLGRIDIFPVGPVPGLALLRQEFTPEERALFAIHPKPLYRRFTHLLFSKAHPGAQKWMTVFDQGMVKLKESGRMADMRADLLAGQYEKR